MILTAAAGCGLAVKVRVVTVSFASTAMWLRLIGGHGMQKLG
jgi:hypothetical protein